MPRPTDRELLARKLRNYRRRLRKNYLHQIHVQSERAIQLANRTIESNNRVAKARIEEAHAKADRAAEAFEQYAREITRMRLEFGPTKFSHRFSLHVAFADVVIHQARDLKGILGSAFDVLAAKAHREIATIDFARVKPIADAIDRTYPQYRIDLCPPTS